MLFMRGFQRDGAFSQRYASALLDARQCAGRVDVPRPLWSSRPRSVSIAVRAANREGFMAITIGVVRESAPGERRVALTPDVAKKYKAKGAAMLFERGAGQTSFPDAAYKDVEIAA